MRCPNCNALGTLSPVGKAGFAGFRRWKCGARAGESGCKRTCAQVVVFGDALGAGSPRAWASVAPMKLTGRISSLEVGPIQAAVPGPRVSKKREGEPKVSTEKASTNAKGLLEEIEVELRKEINTEKGAKLLALLMGIDRTTLAPTSAPEGRDTVVVS